MVDQAPEAVVGPAGLVVLARGLGLGARGAAGRGDGAGRGGRGLVGEGQRCPRPAATGPARAARPAPPSALPSRLPSRGRIPARALGRRTGPRSVRSARSQPTRRQSATCSRPGARCTWLASSSCTENGCAGKGASVMRASTCTPRRARSGKSAPMALPNGRGSSWLRPGGRPGSPRPAPAAALRPKNSRSRRWRPPASPTWRSPRGCSSARRPWTTTWARCSGNSVSAHAVSSPAFRSTRPNGSGSYPADLHAGLAGTRVPGGGAEASA